MPEVILSEIEFNSSILELRHRILHPGGPESRVLYETDKLKSAIHLIVEDKQSKEVLACGSLLPEDDDGRICTDKNRIRGMAVALSAQGQGFGNNILDKMIELTKENGIGYTWCNAREAVLPFYEKRGFKVVGNVFDVPGSGPHFKMIKIY